MKPVSIRPDRPLTYSSGLGSIIFLLLAAVSIAAAIPAARASGEADLLTALRAKGAQVVPLGSRGGLAGYFVRPAKGAGYSLYLTATGHAVAGLLYGPDGALITEDQLATAAAVKAAEMSSNRAGSVARADVSSISPERFDGRPRRDGRCELPGQSAGTANPVMPLAAPAPTDPANGLIPTLPPARVGLLERSAAASGFTLGERGPLIVLFGDARCPWSRSAVAKLGREAIAGRLRLHVVPVALLGAAAARRAAGIASSPDPAQAWFDRVDRPADQAGRERIARNNALFDKWDARSVPLIVWRGRDDTDRKHLGDIADIGAWLGDAGLE